MDPLSIIASTLAILDGVSDAYTGVQKLVNLPKAFKAVRDQLPLAEQLLEAAKVVLEENPNAKTPASDCLRACKQKAVTLRNIFEDLRDTAKESTLGKDSEGQVEWSASSLADAYKSGLMRFKRMAKANKVEKLMKDIMEKLETLSTYQGFKTAAIWQNKMDEITASIDALTTVTEQHPSIEDDDLPDDNNERFQQNIHDNATGFQNINQRDGYMPVAKGDYNNFGSNAQNFYGTVNSFQGAHPAGKMRWTVPRQSSPLFTGRCEVLKQIKIALCKSRGGIKRLIPRSLNPLIGMRGSERTVIVVFGMGGIGKSELCLKVAQDMQNEFWAVFWVDVGTKENAKIGFALVAQALDWPAESTVKETLQALANKKEHWLLILDNADDVNYDYSNYIPSGTHGAIIITSRNHECSKHSTAAENTVPLNELDDDHARRLLLETAKIPQEEWQSREEGADQIVKLLGSHTLGLIQAGAYIAQGFCLLGQYSAEFLKNRRRMLQKGYLKQASSRYDTVYATFEISAKALEDSHSEADQDALELLSVLGMLHSSVLLLDIFKHAWAVARFLSQKNLAETSKTSERDDPKELDLGRWQISHLPKFINIEAKEWDDCRLKAASARLASLSLMTRHSVGDVGGVSMHPLAHVWAKERLQAEQHRQAWITTGCALSFAYCRKDWWWRHLWELQPHILSFVSLDVQEMISLEPSDSNKILAILVSNSCGWMLDWMGEYTKLEKLLQSIYQSLGIDPSTPSPKYWRLWVLAGQNLMMMGRVLEAVKLYESIFETNATTGVLEEVVNNRQLQRYRARAYYLNGQAPEAVKLLEGIINFPGTLLNKFHPERLALQHELAQAHRLNGQISKAIALLQEIIHINQVALDKADSILLPSQHELALAYWDNRQEQEAMELLVHVVEIFRNYLPENNRLRMASEKILVAWQTTTI